MNLTLTVIDGADRGRTITVRPGQAVPVGREDECGLCLRNDPLLSRLHFTVESDGQTCRIRDAGSRFGTKVNDRVVTDEELTDGDLIVAGRTQFVVRVEKEAGSPTPAPPTINSVVVPSAPVEISTDGTQPDATDVLKGYLQGQTLPLYALLDAARDPQILERVRGSGEEQRSLYDGKQGEELAPWAPHLVRLPTGSKFLAQLTSAGWGNSWGIFLTSAKPLADLRRHFRKFLVVKPEGEDPVLFRYYDPRVLRDYLPTCRPDEVARFFGPIDRFLLEDRDPGKLIEFRLGEGHRLNRTVIPLQPEVGRGQPA